MNKLWIIFIAGILFVSCSKEEGEGGNSVITGKVLARVYNNSFTQLIDTMYKPETDVYIVYGDNPTYNERFRTNWDGSYRFEYLRKGNYKIFVYSIDTSASSGSVLYPLTVDVKIPGNNDLVQVKDIEIIETSDYNDGFSSIAGKVFSFLYNEKHTTLIDSFYRPDKDVFIVYGEDKFYFDDVKTQYDGSFKFENLIKGTYILYVLPDNSKDFNLNENALAIDTVVIAENFRNINMEDLVINETGDYNDGTSSISGKIFVLDYNAERTNLLDYYYGPDEDVYIVFGNDQFYFDDVKTYYDGTYEFKNLVKGTYIVYALSNNMVNISSRQLIPVSDTIVITENYQQVVIDDLIISK